MPTAARTLDRFLESVERRAYYMARLATGNEQDALDITQDAMTAFALKYADKPRDSWKPLFYKVQQNKIRDWIRRERFRSRFRGLLGRGRAQDDDPTQAPDPMQDVPDPQGRTPEELAGINGFLGDLQTALATLPHRRRQVFLLRAWEGLSVGETAQAMGCSEGAVKAYYSRALADLRTILEEYTP